MVATKICKRLILNMPTVYRTYTLYPAGTWAQVQYIYRNYDDVKPLVDYSDHPNATIHNKFTIYKVVYCFLIGLFKSGRSYCICGDAYARICIWWGRWGGRFFLNNSFDRIMPLHGWSTETSKSVFHPCDWWKTQKIVWTARGLAG